MRRMWSSLLATVGISAAIYGLSKYRNGKLMEPVQNFMSNAKGMLGNSGMASNNPLMEISEELMPNNLKNNQKKKQKITPINPS